MPKQLNIVQDALMGAIGRLAQQKDFNDISVSELTRVAGISRPTFYRHYHNILDILNVEMQTLLTDFTAQVQFQDNYQYILQTVTFFQEHQTTIKIILAANHEELIRKNIATTLTQLSMTKPQNANFTVFENRYYVLYHTAGLMTVITDWIANDQPIPVKQLAQFLDGNSQAFNKA